MKQRKVLLDTDTLSLYFKQNAQVDKKVKRYLRRYGNLSISSITYFEYMRGLRELEQHAPRRAKEKIEVYRAFLKKIEVLPLTVQVAEKAAEISDNLRRRGEPIGMADVLIAATAITNRYGIATNNEKHYKRVSGLYVENWLNP